MIFYYFILTSLVILSARGEKKCKADLECKENEFCRGFCAPKPTAKPNFESYLTEPLSSAEPEAVPERFGLPLVAHHECQTNEDCPKDQICRSQILGIVGLFKKCVKNSKPGPEVVGCQRDSDCNSFHRIWKVCKIKVKTENLIEG